MASTDDMRGNHYAASDYFQAGAGDGVMRTRGGRRVVALDEDFLRGFREGFEIECGEAADVVMYTCGREYGGYFARQMDADLSEYYGRAVRRLPLAMFAALVEQAVGRFGWGRLSIDTSLHEAGFLGVDVRNGIFAALTERSAQPVESLLAGFVAGLFSYFADEDLHAVQTECESQGRPASRFVIGVEDRLAEVRSGVERGEDHATIVTRLTEGAPALA